MNILCGLLHAKRIQRSKSYYLEVFYNTLGLIYLAGIFEEADA
jgi:hypothetical protein